MTATAGKGPGRAERLRVGRYVVELTHPDRVLFPADGYTKRDLAGYYQAVAGAMLPHVRRRPLNLERFPRGIGEPGFFQQAAPESYPAYVGRVEVAKQGGRIVHPTIDNGATLVFLAGQNGLVLHVWPSRAGKAGDPGDADRPDWMVFDLDPPAGGWPLVRSTAVELRDVLAGIGLAPFVKTSGSKGLHLVVPIVPGPGFDEVRRFAADIAGYLVRRSPDRLTLNSGREGRTDRLYLDVLRNSYGGTVVAPYSVRARDGAPVSAPLDWDEVEDPALDPMTFTIRNMPRRLERRGDPWRDIGRKAGRMDRALRRWTTFLAARAGG